MKVNIRADEVVIEGYVNAIERNSKPLISRTGKFIERICKGAFFNALKRAKNVRALLNHDKAREIGDTETGTLELEEDNIGLKVRLRTSDPEVIEDARNGNLVGWSFGYYDTPNGVEQGIEDGLPLRKVRDMELTEVSLLNRRKNPAYEGTLVNVRSDEGLSEALIEYLSEPMEMPVEVIEEKRTEEAPTTPAEPVQEVAPAEPIDYTVYENLIKEMREGK